MNKTNVKANPSTTHRHDTPNNKTHIIKFRVTETEKLELENPSNGRHWSLGQDQMLDIMSQWGEYELQDIADTSQRASICGVDAQRRILSSPLDRHTPHRHRKLPERDAAQWPLGFLHQQGTRDALPDLSKSRSQ